MFHSQKLILHTSEKHVHFTKVMDSFIKLICYLPSQYVPKIFSYPSIKGKFSMYVYVQMCVYMRARVRFYYY